MRAWGDGSKELPQKVLSSRLMRVSVAVAGVAAGAAAVHFLGKVSPHAAVVAGETLAWGGAGAMAGGLCGWAADRRGGYDPGLQFQALFGSVLGGVTGLVAGGVSWVLIPSAAPVIGSALAIGIGAVTAGAVAHKLYDRYVVGR